jgi:hypothetical protein
MQKREWQLPLQCEETFITIRNLLEEAQGLDLEKETDRLILAHQLSKRLNLRAGCVGDVGFIS